MTKIITIELREGLVQWVYGLPKGWKYQVKDLDTCPDCGDIEPYCENCLEFYREWEEKCGTCYSPTVGEEEKDD